MQIQEILLHYLFTRIDICSCIYALAFLQDIYETFAGIYDGTKIREASCENSHQKYFNFKNRQFIEWGNNKEALLIF